MENDTRTRLRKRVLEICGAIVLAMLFLAGSAYIWFTSEGQWDLPSILFKMVAFAYPFMAVQVISSVLPKGRVKTALQHVAAWPLVFAFLLIYPVTVVLTVGLFVSLLVSVQYAIWLGVSEILSLGAWKEKAFLYVTFVSSLLLLAYWAPRILLPVIRWFLLRVETNHTVSSAEYLPSIYNGTRFLLHKIDFRQIAYLLGTSIYIIGTLEQFAEVEVIDDPTWLNIKSVALESLLAFIAIDAYVSAFHPDIIEREGRSDSAA